MSRLRSALIVVAVLVVMAGPAAFVAFRASQGSASFAADEQVGRNRLTAAELDIRAGERTVPIVGTDLAPGDSRRGSIEFVNGGTVELRYSVGADVVVGDAVELADWMTWTIFWSPDGATCPSDAPDGAFVGNGRVLASGAAIFGDRRAGPDAGDRVLAIEEADLLCLSAALDIDAPNSVQSLTLVQPIVAFAEQAVDTTGATDADASADDS